MIEAIVTGAVFVSVFWGVIWSLKDWADGHTER
jgi:hypothetical protein